MQTVQLIENELPANFLPGLSKDFRDLKQKLLQVWFMQPHMYDFPNLRLFSVVLALAEWNVLSRTTLEHYWFINLFNWKSATIQAP